jgi:hypothetical protein
MLIGMRVVNNYSPVGSPIQGHYRVPVCSLHDLYTVYVGDKFTRVFNSDTLPDEVKVKLTMINALPITNLYSEEWVENSPLHIYTPPKNLTVGYEDVGWRVSETIYCLLLSESCLMSMRGKVENK